MEGWTVSMTKMHEGYMWRLNSNVTEMKLVKITSTPWCGAVD